MLVKIIVVCMLAFMVFNLFRAMKIMLSSDPDQQQSMTKFIGRRVLTSALIMLLLLLALAMGWITPNPRPY
ncbi:DUF2909 domain-containing protein [Lacimicrobium alkaliphilum]|uniref:DUF2909 domain-containing protein n=1 Tax=Lacimicrobium alkaliphilum TaxID=1526571 RepID=A0ABQ1RRL1_9ALTE|nr:DUF2909 domain-containing protein [Lacimicrobium alkaliphilum]GGD77197.1 hypothetical protein GCM10011357_35320 [Lacimicrobium alkaliphilum]